MTRTEQIEKLISAAFDVMHHDADPDIDTAAMYERQTLRRKFREILTGKVSAGCPYGHATAISLADFIELETNPSGFTSMRFGHEKWSLIASALRALALTGETP